MDKSARTEYDLLDEIQKRWSPRAFEPTKGVDPEDLKALLEAASWAPSSMNEQPWRYYYAHRSNEEGFQKLLDCLMEGNQVWAKNAAVLMAITYRERLAKNDKKNVTAPHDTGLANATLVLEATKRGLHAHMMGGYHKDKTIEQLGLEDESPICFMALGYRAAPESLPTETLVEREQAKRTRKSIDEISRELR